MARSIEMGEVEGVLSRAMVATITGNRPRVSLAEVVELLLSSLELAEGDFTVHAHHPEDFLIIFSSLATMRRSMASTSSARRVLPFPCGHGVSWRMPPPMISDIASSWSSAASLLMRGISP